MDDKKIILAPKNESQTPILDVKHFEAAMEYGAHKSMMEVEDKDPTRDYRLVANAPARIRYWNRMGFTIDDSEQYGKMVDSGQVDGRKVIGAGELVLMSRPKEYRDMHREALKRKAYKTRRGPIENFKSEAGRLGVEVIDKTREYVGPIEAALSEKDDD